jgi:hypothetical protein
MPSATYPNEFTFYKIQDQDDLSISQVTDEIKEFGILLEMLEADEHENSFRANSAIKFAEVIESILEEFEYETSVIATEGADYFDNARPYEIEFFTKNFNIFLCQSPFMAMAVFRGSEQVKALLSGIQELANNEYFSENDHNLGIIANLLRSSLVEADGSEECAIIVILRSYYLHNA